MTIRILLVDDNQTFVTAVRQFLDMWPGVEIVGQAQNGRQALEMTGKLKPNLLLLDLSMPEMDGLEVARRMLPWPHAPRIVFLSIHDNVAYRAMARELGAAKFIGKTNFVGELLPYLEVLATEESTSIGFT